MSEQTTLLQDAQDPLRLPCTYPGHRYALPCRALPGEPCRWPRTPPPARFHAERRRAAGEPLKTYGELYGGEVAAPIEDAPEDDGEDPADADAEVEVDTP